MWSQYRWETVHSLLSQPPASIVRVSDHLSSAWASLPVPGLLAGPYTVGFVLLFQLILQASLIKVFTAIVWMRKPDPTH